MKITLLASVSTLSLMLCTMSNAIAAVSSGNVNDITPVCIGSSLTFAAETNEPDARTTNPGHAYGDLNSAPNPAWFYFKVDVPGTLIIDQNNDQNKDVDGALWGPFDTVPDLVRDGVNSVYDVSLLIDSDYAGSPTFSFEAEVDSGKYYVLLIANYSGQDTEISMDTGAGTAATTDCSITYGVDLAVDGAGTSSTESGTTDTYAVTLYRQPAQDVTVTLASTLGEVSTAPGSLLFTAASWDVPQTVTVTAIDDSLFDGDQTDTITHTTSSTDTNYNGLGAEMAAIAVDDNDLAVPTVTALSTNDNTPTITGTHTSGATLTVTLDGTSYTEGDGSLTDNGDGTWTLAVSTSIDDGTYDVGATSTSSNQTLQDNTSADLTIDTAAPALTLSVNAVTADNVLNAAEAGSTVAITGSVGGEFDTGDTVTLDVGGQSYSGMVDAVGGYSIDVPGSVLETDTSIEASASSTDASGNAGTIAATRTYEVDVTDPSATVALDVIASDDILNASESAGDASVTGTVGGEFTASDVVTLTVNSTTYSGTVNGAGVFSIVVPGADLAASNSVAVSVNATDAAGNTAAASNSRAYTVDTNAPVPAITVNDITDDNILNATESASSIGVTGTVTGEFNDGDTVTLSVDGSDYSGVVNASGVYNISVPGSALENDTSVAASFATTDAAGNPGSATDNKSYTVDTTAPASVLTIDDVTDDNQINAEESELSILVTGEVTGDFTEGDSVTLTVNGNTYTGVVSALGTFSIAVPGAQLEQDTTVLASAITSDSAGNTSTVSANQGYSVDTTVPVLAITVNDITADNIVNAAEADAAITVTGAVTGDFSMGDTVTLISNANSQTGTVDALGNYSISVPGSDLAQDPNVLSSVESTDSAGNTGTGSLTHVHAIDTAAPGLNIALDAVTADNILNAAEASGNVSITGTVTGDFLPGDTVTVAVNAQNFTGTINGAGLFNLTMPGSDLAASTSLTASVSTSDAAGNPGSASVSGNYSVDTAAPVPSIVLDSIAGDDILNASEAAASVTVTGSVGGDFSTGDTVTLSVDGNPHTGVVNASGAFSIPVPGSDLAADTTVLASVATTDAAGNPGSSGASRAYTVDTLAPVPVLVLDSVTTDNVINAAEAAGNVAVTGTVSGDFNTGDGVSVTVNAQTFSGSINPAGQFSITIPGSDLADDTILSASFTTTDGAGNEASTSDTQNYTVDTASPALEIALDAVTADNILNAAEASGNISVTGTVTGEFMPGDTVTVAVNGQNFTGTINGAGLFSLTVPGSDLAASTSLTASVSTSDAAGNPGSASVSGNYSVDTAAPVPSIALDSIAGDDILNAAEAAASVTVTGSVGGDFSTGDTVSLSVDGNAHTGVVNAAGDFSIPVPGSDLAADTTVLASVATNDSAGNPGNASIGRSYTVDTAVPAPLMVIDSITSDDVINAAEAAANVIVTGNVSGEFSTGDTVTVSVNGNTFTSTLEAAGNFSVSVPGGDLAGDTELTATIATSDAAGNPGTDSANRTYTVDTGAPLPVLAIDSITDDNVLNAAEAAGSVAVTGTVSGEFSIGDDVSITVNAQTFTVPVNAAGQFSVAVPGSDLAADSSVSASMTTTDDAGNEGSTTDSLTYTVDTTSPAPSVALDAIAGDNILNAAEAVASVTVTGNAGGDFNAGDTVTASVDGNSFTAQLDAAGAFTMSIPGSVLAESTTASVSLETTDLAGNSSTVSNTQTYLVDTSAPVPTLSIDALTGDGILNASEASGPVPVSGSVTGEYSEGDTVSLESNGTTTTGTVDAAGGFTIAVPGADLAADTSISASISTTDAAGNNGTATATSAYSVDTTQPVLVADEAEDSDKARPVFSGTTDEPAGSQVTLTDSSGNSLCVATVVAATPANTWQCVPDTDLPDGSNQITVTIDDDAGNSTSVSLTVLVDTAAPIISAIDQNPVSSSTPDFAGTTDEAAGSTVSISNDSGDVLCIATVGVDGQWSCSPTTPLAEGNYSLTASISDSVGNTATATFTVVVDLDSDDDGIPDVLEGTVDSDLDGIADYLDSDSDNDGISDAEEASNLPELSGVDSDADGIDDAIDASLTGGADANDNGIDDQFEPVDTDSDGIADYLDTDSDDDGIADIIETRIDSDEDGTPDYLDRDADGDGIDDAVEASNSVVATGVDSDADGIDDSIDVDITGGADRNGNGIDDALEPIDSDGDGIANHLDADSDGDGISDEFEGTSDLDGDGTLDYVDLDSNNDGISDSSLGNGDLDGDGVPDYLDDDIDGDGLSNLSESGNGEATDTDGDGIPDYVDTDSDGDGIADLLETSGDLDADGIPNFMDLDSDGDGLNDAEESGVDALAPVDTDQDGLPDFLDTDSDGDSLPDSVESSGESDVDGDGVPNHLDVDSDNDGVADAQEGIIDTDGDGVPDSNDIDSDGDGISDENETGADPLNPQDTDGDGVIDALDLDSDNDGIPDSIEAGVRPGEARDSDRDGIPDHRDLDSDNDGLTDLQEAGGDDQDGNGRVDDFTDADGNGLDDGVQAVPLAVQDSDGDGVRDYRDLDSDNDSLSDALETQGVAADRDRNGVIDDFVDSNGNGLDDGVESLPVVLDDIDADGIPDQLDTDTDGDGTLDIVEAGMPDLDNDGVVDSMADSDNDGIPDLVDVDVTSGADADADGIDDSADSDFNPQEGDLDFDGIIDSRDPDRDGDGFANLLSDSFGAGPPAPLPDTDDNGVPDVEQPSSPILGAAGGQIRTGVAGSGCSVVGTGGAHDPLLTLMALIAGALALYRRRTRATLVVLAAVSGLLFVDTLDNRAEAADTTDTRRTLLTTAEVLYPVPRFEYQDDDAFQRRFYAGFGLGMSRLEPETGAIEGVDVNDRVNNGAHLMAGLDVNKWVSLELHGTELGSAGLSPTGAINYRTFGGSALFYAGKNRHRFKRQGLSLYGRLGYGYLSNHRDGDSVNYVKDNATHVIFGAGLEYTGRRGLGIRAEGLYFDADARYGQLSLLYRFGKPSAAKRTLIVEQRRTQVPVFGPMTAIAVPKPLDTDHDGIADSDDRCESTLAGIVVNADGCAILSGVIDGVEFPSNSAVLTEQAREKLADVVTTLQAHNTVRIEVSAHTDDSGPAEANQALSKRRVTAVGQYLVQAGIPSERFVLRAYGESRPLVSNLTAEGRRRNRRVELSMQAR